jgi:glycosyltransferase involved in cell wall biosynthesis
MRIMMLAQFYPPTIGGEERHVRNLSAALARRGHDVTVATLQQSGLPNVEMDGDVKIRRLQGSVQRLTAVFAEPERTFAPPFPDPELVYGLANVIAEERPHVVHAHNWLLHSFLPLKRRNGPRFVVTLHDFSLVCARKIAMYQGELCSGPGLRKCLSCTGAHYGRTKGSVTALSNWASAALERRLVDKFLAVSSAVAAGNGLARSNVPYEVIPNFVPDDVAKLSAETPSNLDLLPEPGYLLYVGDLIALKGVRTLIDAYASLESAPPLVLIGRQGPDTPTELPPNVHIFNNWPHAAIMHAWDRSLFGLAPSILPEACATVVMEAMSLGKPVIATRVGGMVDLVDDEKTGLLVPPNDADALAGAMRRLLQDSDLRARMSTAALTKVEQFRARTVVPRIEDVYSKLLAVEGDTCMTGVPQTRRQSPTRWADLG